MNNKSERDQHVVSLLKIAKTYSEGGSSIAVLSDFCLHIRAREITAILGPTGCGKSTLLAIISGRLAPSRGEMRYCKPRKLLRIGTVPQKDTLVPWRTVFANAHLSREILGNLGGDEAALNVLKSLDLREYSELYPDQLSGGMRQKLAMARALLLDPDLLLLDEPFSNIDFQQKLILETYVCEWVRSRGRSCIIVTHDVEEAIAMADRVLVLSGHKPARLQLDFRPEFDNASENPWQRRKNPAFFSYVERTCGALAY